MVILLSVVWVIVGIGLALAIIDKKNLKSYENLIILICLILLFLIPFTFINI